MPVTKNGTPLVDAAPEMLQALREVAGDCYVLDPESRTGPHPKLREEDLAHCRFCDHAEGKAHDVDCTMNFVIAAIQNAEQD